ncbi:hypothetical protein CPB97_009109, partial [Podila verticillata]
MRGQCFASTHAEQPQATTRPPSLPSQLHHDPLDTPTPPTLRPHATHHSLNPQSKSRPYPFCITLLLIATLFSCLTTSLTLAQPAPLVPALPNNTSGPPNVTTTEILAPSPSATALPATTPTYLGLTSYTDYPVQSIICSETPRQLRFSIITHVSHKNDGKLDISSVLPIQPIDVLANIDYQLDRMKSELDAVVKESQATDSRGPDAVLVSIPDDRLKDSIQKVIDVGIPVVAVYTGLQAAQDLDILAVMADDYESGRLIGEQLVHDGVLAAFTAKGRSVSSNLTDHLHYVEKPSKNNNSTASTNVQAVADAILDKKDVTAIVYLSGATFLDSGPLIEKVLNGTRSFKTATFDYSGDQLSFIKKQELSYSIASLMYLQT